MDVKEVLKMINDSLAHAIASLMFVIELEE